MAWGYRESLYLTALVVLLFCLNVTPREVPTWRFARAFSQLFTWTVILGTVALLVPNVNLTTPMELALPRSFRSIDFIASQVQANMGVVATAIDAVRPAAPYGYTNEWGAALGVLWPLAVYSTYYVRSRRARLWVIGMLAFSIVPVIISVNRGLWISLIVALAVVALRAGIARHVKTTITALVVAAAAALVILLTPLADVISNRLVHENVSTRETLATGAIELTRQSPVFGFGAPQTVSVANSNDVAVGTHGQIYTLLVSHGIPGTFFYIAFFLAALYVTRKVSGPAVWAWAAIVVCLVQLPFYNSIPVPLMLAMMALACCLRELGWRGRPLTHPSVTIE
jgi:O-antigen ligase